MWRAWVLARALDDGSGFIETDLFVNALNDLGVSERTGARWLACAIEFGLMFYAKGRQRLVYVSEKRASKLYGGKSTKRKVVIRLAPLFDSGWKARVWAGYIKTAHNGKIISRATLEDLTGVPERAQRNIDRFVKRKRNFAVTERGADFVNTFIDHSDKKGVFVFTDKGKGDKVAHALPSRVSVSNNIATVGASSKLYFAACQETCNYPVFSWQTSSKRDIWILYYLTQDEKQRAYKLASHIGRRDDPDNVYLRRGHKSKTQVFDSLPMPK